MATTNTNNNTTGRQGEIANVPAVQTKGTGSTPSQQTAADAAVKQLQSHKNQK